MNWPTTACRPRCRRSSLSDTPAPGRRRNHTHAGDILRKRALGTDFKCDDGVRFERCLDSVRVATEVRRSLLVVDFEVHEEVDVKPVGFARVELGIVVHIVDCAVAVIVGVECVDQGRPGRGRPAGRRRPKPCPRHHHPGRTSAPRSARRLH